MQQSSDASNGIQVANRHKSDFDSARKLSGVSPSAPAGRRLLSTRGDAVRMFAFRLGWRYAELMFRLRRGYAAWKRARESRKAPPQDIVSQTSAARGRARRSASVRVLRTYGLALAGLIVVGSGVLAAGMFWALHDLSLEPDPEHASRPSLVVEASNGAPLGRVGPLKTADVTRQDLPDHLVQAVLSLEDRRFYSHFGIDPFGIVRAARRNLSAGEIVEGGSTITQQLVKMLYVGNDRNFGRKLREALTAIWVDMRLPKDEILTRYLNTVYFGSGAYGIGAAARLYFNKQVAELTLAESAMLAGLIRAPSQYSPLRDLAVARARAAVVLDSMVETGAIDAKTAASSKAEPAVLNSAAAFAPAESWFANWIAQEAAYLTGSSDRSIRVRTTLQPKIQALAEKIIEDTLAKHGARAKASQAALVAMRPDGAVIAMVGGRDYRTSRFNRATEANRHPGSAFKVFVYLAALRKGYSPNHVIDAGPVAIKKWRPENFGGAQYGQVTLADALARSINTAAVRLAMDVGLKDVIKAARDLGIDARMEPVPSLALGAVGVSLLDLTGAFASLRAGRTGLEPWGIAAFGEEHSPYMHTAGPPIARSAQSLGSTHQPMLDMLRGVVEHGTGRSAAVGGFAAGKTGTSQNHRDAWFVGFTNSLVVGVWVGNDDNTPMRGVVGGTLPASIWRQFVGEATPLLESDETEAAAIAAPATETSQEARPACDVQVCAARYRSFRASDCTYQPYSGERRLCEAGDPTVASATPEQNTVTQAAASTNGATNAFAQAHCNVDVCARRYRSFNASDCTYQPYGGGPRQVCEAGGNASATARPVSQRTQWQLGSESDGRSGGWRRGRGSGSWMFDW